MDLAILSFLLAPHQPFDTEENLAWLALRHPLSPYHVIVILQLKLTLYWNRVSELSELWTSVGQLIPFIIGVCGLGLVISK
jgi:hypothetical protein